MLNYYGKLSSEVYDIDKPIGHSFGDVEFYMDRLESCKGPILEPATGTGRILIPLLEKGLNVDGFDSSKDMLKIYLLESFVISAIVFVCSLVLCFAIVLLTNIMTSKTTLPNIIFISVQLFTVIIIFISSLIFISRMIRCTKSKSR